MEGGEGEDEEEQLSQGGSHVVSEVQSASSPFYTAPC